MVFFSIKIELVKIKRRYSQNFSGELELVIEISISTFLISCVRDVIGLDNFN